MYRKDCIRIETIHNITICCNSPISKNRVYICIDIEIVKLLNYLFSLHYY